MNIKKILCSVLAMAMILSTIGTVVFADDTTEVLQVGDTKYTAAQVEEAIAAWESTNNSTMTLLADVTLPRTIEFDSTEHHILKLGSYTLTAAEKSHAISIVVTTGVGAVERNCVTICANEDGGISAPGYSCVYYRNTSSQQIVDRAITTIDGGTYNAAYVINSSSHSKLNDTKVPTYKIIKGTFNGYISISKGKLIIEDGTFNSWINCTGSSTAYRLIKKGKFKQFQFLTADAANKFAIGSAMSVYDVGVYVDENNYLVVGGPVITENDGRFTAHTTYYEAWSSYLERSSAATHGLYFVDAETAASKSKSGTVILNTEVFSNMTASASLTVDVTADAAAYYGNVTLGGKNAKFVIKMKEDAEYSGKVTPYKPYNKESYVLVVEEVVADGIKTITYSSRNDIEPVASVGTSKFATVQAAVDYAEIGDTVTLEKDVTENVVFKAPAIAMLSANDIDLDLNSNTLTGNIVIEQGAAATIKNGNIVNTDANVDAVTTSGTTVLDNVNVTSAKRAVYIAGGLTSIKGGTYTAGENLDAVAATSPEMEVITGGKFSSNVNPYVADGYTTILDEYGVYHVIQTDAVAGDNTVTPVAEQITVSLVPVTDDATKYDVVLTAPQGEAIHRFLSAELDIQLNNATETLSIKTVEGNAALKIETIDPIYEANDVWGFHLDENAEKITANEIKIGTVVLTGVGTGKLNVVANTKNKVEAIESVSGNIVKKYVDDATAEAKLVLPATATDVEVKKPTQKLTIQITFPNNILDNVVDYQDMTVTVDGKDIETKTYKLGTGNESAATLSDNKYVVEIDGELTKDHAYNIEVKGAGYRTANYRVVMTEDKVVYFWNDASIVKLPYEVGGKVETFANFLAGDIAEDNIIDKYDLAAVVSYFGRYGMDRNGANAYAKYDLNRDGDIDSEDIAYVLASFGY